MKPRLTIGMPTYREPGGVYYTIQNLVMQLGSEPFTSGQIEVIVVDNSPESFESSYLRDFLKKSFPWVRLVELITPKCAAIAKDRIFQEASAEIVICIDGHVLVSSEAVSFVYSYLDDSPYQDCFIHGPILRGDMTVAATHFEPGFNRERGIMFGNWALDKRGLNVYDPPFEIGYMGMGAFACRRERWPGMNPRFRGLCAEEGYTHDKFRQKGGQVVCLPAFRWIHRPNLPEGYKYRQDERSALYNYMLQKEELRQNPLPTIAHFEERIGVKQTLSGLEAALDWGGLSDLNFRQTLTDEIARLKETASSLSEDQGIAA